jgi:maltose alpha-D-glucosyltransferase / alpha-amylase
MPGPTRKSPGNFRRPTPRASRYTKELKKVMKFWLDLGADGFRVDMASSLIRNDQGHQAINTLWRYYRSCLENEYPKAVLISEWSDPAVAIPAGFHIDSLLQFREPYRILLGPESRLDGDARIPHAFFEPAGGGDIKVFIDEYLRHYTATKPMVTSPFRRAIMTRRVRPGGETNKTFALFLRCCSRCPASPSSIMAMRLG